MKKQLLAIIFICITSSAGAQSRFWQNLNHSKDSIASFVSTLTNPVLHYDSIYHGADSVFIDTFTTYDTTWYTDTIGTVTYYSQLSVFEIAVLAQGTIVAAADAGILRTSDDGVTWTAGRGVGLGDRYFSSLCMGAKGVLYSGSFRNFYRSLDGGLTWDSLPHNGLIGGVVSVRYSPNGFLFVRDAGSNIWRTSDEGQTWKYIPGESNWCDDLLITPRGTLLVRGGGAMKFSTNNGDTWRTRPAVAVEMGYDPSGTTLGTLVAVIWNGSSYFVDRSFDEGQTWTAIGPWQNTHGNVRSAAVAPGGQVLMSGKDRYTRWRDTAYALCTFDIGAPPMNVSRGVFNRFLCYAFDSSGHVYGGTEGSGIFRATLPAFVSASVRSEKSRSLELSLFPNPVSGTATISYTPEASGYAEIAIVNMLGQEVERVYSGVLDESEHRFTWEAQAKACATGMYECVAHMNGKTLVLPIAVL